MSDFLSLTHGRGSYNKCGSPYIHIVELNNSDQLYQDCGLLRTELLGPIIYLLKCTIVIPIIRVSWSG